MSLVHSVLPDSPYIWIDTLCIPVSPNFRSARKAAIAKMAYIYQSAEAVIVLDRHLQLTGDDIYERGLQVLCSEWATRLWTLQEAVLPGTERLHVCFKNEVVQWNQICNPSASENARIWDPLEETLHFRLVTMFGNTQSAKELTPDALLELSEALRGRTTSNAPDEYICLAHLLGLDLKKMPTLPSSMDSIIEKIPLSPELIFLPGERMTRQSFRWCPASLLEQKVSSATRATGVAEQTERGLALSKASVNSMIPLSVIKNTRYILVENDKPILMFKTDIEDLDQLNRRSKADIVSRPVFILSFDFKQVMQDRGTVKAALVEQEGDSNLAAFLFNLVLVRTDLIDHITREDDISILYVPVQYREAAPWIID